MTVKIYYTLCGIEIPEETPKGEGPEESEGWNEWVIIIKNQPWGDPHSAFDTPIDLGEVCDKCAKRIIVVVKAEIKAIKDQAGVIH